MMKKEVLNNAFRHINNLKREITMNHPELFTSPVVMQNLFELELTMRTIQSEAHKAGLIDEDKR